MASISQAIALRGRRAATSAPTVGKVVISKAITTSTSTLDEWFKNPSSTRPVASAINSAQSDHASQATRRLLINPESASGHHGDTCTGACRPTPGDDTLSGYQNIP